MPDANEVSLTVRFWSRVQPFDVRDKSACALWLGHRLPAGYGTVTDADGVQHYAHRASWSLLHGDIPAGHVIRHLCDNPSCVRPGHLALGTHADNAADKVEAGRIRVLPDLTADDIVAIRYCYATGRWSQGDLARMFLGDGAGQPTIQRIVSGASYTDLGGPRTTMGRGKPPRRRSA
tara:strand:+ start:3138 stop:3668 length:531 start_codon:yes stop_codon:yes gene_type:complete